VPLITETALRSDAAFTFGPLAVPAVPDRSTLVLPDSEALRGTFPALPTVSLETDIDAAFSTVFVRLVLILRLSVAAERSETGFPGSELFGRAFPPLTKLPEAGKGTALLALSLPVSVFLLPAIPRLRVGKDCPPFPVAGFCAFSVTAGPM
jgi:hypothetical protein